MPKIDYTLLSDETLFKKRSSLKNLTIVMMSIYGLLLVIAAVLFFTGNLSSPMPIMVILFGGIVVIAVINVQSSFLSSEIERREKGGTETYQK